MLLRYGARMNLDTALAQAHDVIAAHPKVREGNLSFCVSMAIWHHRREPAESATPEVSFTFSVLGKTDGGESITAYAYMVPTVAAALDKITEQLG